MTTAKVADRRLRANTEAIKRTPYEFIAQYLQSEGFTFNQTRDLPTATFEHKDKGLEIALAEGAAGNSTTLMRPGCPNKIFRSKDARSRHIAILQFLQKIGMLSNAPAQTPAPATELTVEQSLAALHEFLTSKGLEQRQHKNSFRFERIYDHKCGFHVHVSSKADNTLTQVTCTGSTIKVFRTPDFARRLQHLTTYLKDQWPALQKAYNDSVDYNRAVHAVSMQAYHLRNDFDDIVNPENHLHVVAEEQRLHLTYNTDNPAILRKLLHAFRKIMQEDK